MALAQEVGSKSLFTDAGAALEASGQYAEAAASYEQAGQYNQAAEAYIKVGGEGN